MSREYVDRIDVGGTVGYVKETLTGEGAPTEETVGFIGQRYFDIVAQVEYVCVYSDLIGTLWRKRTSEGGGLPEYTEADEGKGLRIVNGVPTWKDVTVSDVIVSYDATTGEMTITSASGANVNYNEDTGELTIGG